MPPVMGAIDDHEAPGCRQRDGENQPDGPHESPHRAPPFCRVRRPGRGSIPQSARRSAVKSRKLVGGPGGGATAGAPPPDPVRNARRSAVKSRKLVGGPGGGATAGAPPRVRKERLD